MTGKRIGPAVCAVIGIALVGGSVRPSKLAAASKSNKAREAFGRMPLYFEPNVGQADSSARFVSRGAESRMLFKEGSVQIGLDGHTNVSMRFLGSNPGPVIEGVDPRPGKSNYLIGNNPKNWHADINQFEAIRYKQLYPGIDAVFHAHQQQMEYDFDVAPGADPNAIAFTFDGVKKVSLSREGDLVLKTEAGEVRQLRPDIYQRVDGTKQTIQGRYEIRRKSNAVAVVGFRVDKYDRSRELVIDPVFTFTASGSQPVFAVASDSLGYFYLAGITNSTDFPIKNGFQPAYHNTICTQGNTSSPCGDAYIVKLDPTATSIVYSTVLGGAGDDEIFGMAIDAGGNIHVVGDTTSADFPTANAFQPAKKGDRDIFVTELNPAGSALVYSTFFGGTQYDQGNGLALDGAGNTYIIGSTQSTDFPTKGPFQASNKGGSDGVVAKFDPSGSLVYSSYFGGKSFEGINGIAVDSAGNVYMSGYTQSADFPTVSPIQGTLTPTPGQPFGSDAFVAKINAAGSALVYSTFLGGSGSDFAFSIAVDSAGNAYVTGETNSTNFPLANAFQSKAGGGTCTPFPNFSQPATTPS